MKRTHTVLSLGLCLALLLSMAGCKADPTVATPPPAASSPSDDAAPDFSTTGMKIALCTSPESLDDDARNSACYNGILAFIVSRSGLDSISPLQESTGDSSVILKAFGGAVSIYDVMVCVGPAFSGFAEIAQAHPDKYFIMVDQPLTDRSGNVVELDNVYSMSFAEQECGFFAGVVAAMETRTGRVAVVTDTPSPASLHYYSGFRSGIAYSNGNLGTNAEFIDYPDYAGVSEDGTYLGGNYTQGRSATAYDLAHTLMDVGCDVLFCAAGASGNGLFSAVREEEDVMVIGSEGDQFNLGAKGSSNVVLTSVTKDFSGNLQAQLQAIADGTFRGGTYTLRADADATGYVTAKGRQQLSPETLKALEDIYPQMQDGTIVPRSDLL